MLLNYEIKNNTNNVKKFKLIALFSCLYFAIFFIINTSLNTKIIKKPTNLNLRKIINGLKVYSKYRQPKYYLFSDYFVNKHCSDINAFTLFEYYLKYNNDDAYYIINNESELYQKLKKEKRTKNLIIILLIRLII